MMPDEKLVSIEYKKDGQIFVRGNKFKKKSASKKKKRKLFMNQITTEYLIIDKKIINCKIFTNGSLQMTGCRDKNDAIEVAKHVVGIIKSHDCYDYTALNPNCTLSADEKERKAVKIYNFSIKMINSNFHFNFKIDRDKLKNIISLDYPYLVEYDPLSYPGVKIKFRFYVREENINWNVEDVIKWLHLNDCSDCINPFIKHSICGKKLLLIDNKKLLQIGINDSDMRNKLIKKINNNKKFIKVITILIFRTGEVIITGANSVAQVNATYNFIITLVEKYKSELIIK